MNHIFISYSHRDTKYIEKLEHKLKAEGFDVWIDHRIDYGSRWTKAIERAIDTCDAYIVVMSENAKDSQWVQREVIHAERRGKPFFPVLLDGEFWFSLGNIQFADARGGKLPPAKFYQRLGKVVPRKAQGEVHTPPEPSWLDKLRANPKKIFAAIGVLAILALSIWAVNKLLEEPEPPQPIDVDPTLTQSLPAEPTEIPLTPPADAQLGDTWIRPTDGMVMSYIPAGEFQMGSEDGEDDEKPVHTVYLDAFWMDQTEVTNVMYAECVSNGRCEEPSQAVYLENPDYAHHPVINVSWENAQNYCDVVAGRLPTESEWEKAARGGLDGKKYPWSDESPVCTPGAENGAQFDDCDGRTVSVGNFSPNDYGLYDTSGNVWEWVNDWYDSGHYWYSRTNNPSVPSSGELRVLRGGSWDVNSDDLRSANRNWFSPDRSNANVGFRCARSATE